MVRTTGEVGNLSKKHYKRQEVRYISQETKSAICSGGKQKHIFPDVRLSHKFLSVAKWAEQEQPNNNADLCTQPLNTDAKHLRLWAASRAEVITSENFWAPKRNYVVCGGVTIGVQIWTSVHRRKGLVGTVTGAGHKEASLWNMRTFLQTKLFLMTLPPTRGQGLAGRSEVVCGKTLASDFPPPLVIVQSWVVIVWSWSLSGPVTPELLWQLAMDFVSKEALSNLAYV